jgi:uncharacterized protein (DUF433 family)/class 3 adenylate cyclase
MNWCKHIVSDPAILRGKPCIKGTRIPAALVLGYLAVGRDAAGIRREFPDLRASDIAACRDYKCYLDRFKATLMSIQKKAKVRRYRDGNTYKRRITRKDSGKAFSVFGAIGNYFFSSDGFEKVGLPTSEERWMGSGPARYQLFDRGMIAYDANSDRAYAPIQNNQKYAKGKKSAAFVAFTDLRGFTEWSKNQKPKRIQEVLNALEEIHQKAFLKRQVFVKSTGDGIMIVSETGGLGLHGRLGTQDGEHANPAWFLRDCARLVNEAKKNETLRRDFALGCGIDYGEITQTFFLGQWDYFGKEVNNAAKLQQHAWNEIVVSRKFQDALNKKNKKLARKGQKLAKRAVRYSADEVIKALSQ